jgi:hypothetical protein
MNCPIDGTELLIAEHHGVEIDCCPKCRGVWMDRGEIDKLIERAIAAETGGMVKPKRDAAGYHDPYAEAQYPRRETHDRYDDDDDDRHRRDPRDPRDRRRKSFLGEVFDIFD